MSDLPNYSAHGYHLERQLSETADAGRCAYLARDGAGRAVVVKQFSMGSDGASWDGLRDHEREVQTLRSLDHPRIPAYVGHFETDDGFCLVQAFCAAPSMAARKLWDGDLPWRAARSLLEVLSYVQSLLPPLVHRDIKPENVLVDDDGNAFLVDFGLARGDRAVNTTIAVGTPGYMPPEQLLGRELTPATDLYALGASLIVILTGTPSHRVGDLVDDTFAFDLDRLPANVPRPLRTWISRLVAPRASDRFQSADEALASLNQALVERSRPAPERTPQTPTRSKRRPKVAAPSPTPSSLPARAAGRGDRSNVGSWIAIMILVITGVGVGLFILVSVDVDSGPVDEPDTTLTCREAMRLTDDLVVDHGSIVEALPGCRLRVDGARLAGQSITVHDGAELTIAGATLELGGRIGIKLIGDARLTIESSEIRAAQFGVWLEGTSRATLTGVEGTCGDKCVVVDVSAGRNADLWGGVEIVDSTLANGLQQNSGASTVSGSTLGVGRPNADPDHFSVAATVILRGGRLQLSENTIRGPAHALDAEHGSILDATDNTFLGTTFLPVSEPGFGTANTLEPEASNRDDVLAQTAAAYACELPRTCLVAPEMKLGTFGYRVEVSAEGTIESVDFTRADIESVTGCMVEQMLGAPVLGADSLGAPLAAECHASGTLLSDRFNGVFGSEVAE